MRFGTLRFKPDATGNADGGAGAAGADAAAGAGAAGVAAGSTDAAAAVSQDAAAAAAATETGKTFTQAELDAIVKREKTKAAAATKAELEESARTAAMSETERLKTEAETAKKAAADAKAAADSRIIKAEAKIAALAAGVNPERLEHVLRLLDLSDVAMDDEGTVDAKALGLAVAGLKKDLPELFGAAAASGNGSGAADFSGGGSGKRIWSRAEIAALSGTPEYAKHRDDILAASAEGRIRG